MDIHKICACFADALLSVDVIQYDESCADKDGCPEQLAILRFLLAVSAALRSLYTWRLYMCSIGKISKAGTFYQKLSALKHFVFPQTHKGHVPYILGVVMGVARFYKVNSRKFDVLSFANSLFLIETYTYEHILCGLQGVGGLIKCEKAVVDIGL